MRERAEALERAAPPGTIVVHVVPLLFEGEAWRTCDATVVVWAPRETRLARVEARNGWPRAEIERRIAAQIDPDEARRRADFVIENDGDLAHLRARVAEVYTALRERVAG